MNSQVPDSGSSTCPLRRRRAVAVGLPLVLLAGLCLTVFVLALRGADRLERAGLIARNSWLLGFDSGRVIIDMTQPGSNLRSNIHPLFTAVVRPVSRLIMAAGCRPTLAAILLNTLSGLAVLALMFLFARRWGVGPWEALLMSALTASSSIGALLITIPETYCVSMISLLLLFLLCGRVGSASPRRGAWCREAGWLGAGILAFGMNVSNGMQAFLLYWAGRRGWRGLARAALYGAVVLAAGWAAGLAAGSYMSPLADSWLVTHAEGGAAFEHPLAHAVSVFLVFGMVAPLDGLKAEPFGTGEWIVTFLHWRYDLWGWILVACWGGALGWSLWAMHREADSDARRLWMALGGCVLWNLLVHCFYYAAFEGAYMYGGNVLPALIALLTPGMRRLTEASPRGRWIGRAMWWLFVAAIAGRHYRFIAMLPGLFPSGR